MCCCCCFRFDLRGLDELEALSLTLLHFRVWKTLGENVCPQYHQSILEWNYIIQSVYAITPWPMNWSINTQLVIQLVIIKSWSCGQSFCSRLIEIEFCLWSQKSGSADRACIQTDRTLWSLEMLRQRLSQRANQLKAHEKYHNRPDTHNGN